MDLDSWIRDKSEEISSKDVIIGITNCVIQFKTLTAFAEYSQRNKSIAERCWVSISTKVRKQIATIIYSADPDEDTHLFLSLPLREEHLPQDSNVSSEWLNVRLSTCTYFSMYYNKETFRLYLDFPYRIPIKSLIFGFGTPFKELRDFVELYLNSTSINRYFPSFGYKCKEFMPYFSLIYLFHLVCAGLVSKGSLTPEGSLTNSLEVFNVDKDEWYLFLTAGLYDPRLLVLIVQFTQ